MLNAKRKLLVGLVLLIAGTTCLRANADEDVYTLASFQGDYAIVGSGGANVAGLLGTIMADGQGNVSGSASANLPGPSARMLVHITYSGTYTINPDGTGVVTLTVTLPNSKTATGTLDVLITQAKDFEDEKLATEIAAMQRELVSALNGQLVTYKFTRRPH